MRIVLGVILVIIYTNCISCNNCNYSENCISHSEINKQISSNTDTVQLNIKSIIAGDYDEYMLIPPYTVLSRVSERLNIDLECVEKTGISIADDKILFCFLKDRKVVKSCMLSIINFDFAYIDTIKVLNVEEDSLKFFKPSSHRIMIFQSKLRNP